MDYLPAGPYGVKRLLTFFKAFCVTMFFVYNFY